MRRFARDNWLALLVGLCLSAGALAQSLPTTTTVPTTSQPAVVVAISPNSAPAFGGNDGGLVINSPPFTVEQLEFVCCGTSFTAFPAALGGRASLSLQNYGPGSIAFGPDGGLTILNGTVVPGGSSSSASPSSALPLGCVSAVAQTDGGCTAIQEVK